MKKGIYTSKLISAIVVTILLTRSIIITPSPKIIFVPFLICSISMAVEQIGLILNKRKLAIIFNKLFTIGFFMFWFGCLVFAAYLCFKERNIRLFLFTIPFWVIGIYIVKNKLLHIKPGKERASNHNFAMIISAGLVGVVLLSGVAILVLGIIRADMKMLFMGGFFAFGAFTFVLTALTAMGRFDKYKIDILGLYVGIFFVIIGSGILIIKYTEMGSITETLQAFKFWILVPIIMIEVGVLQIIKCLKNRG